TTWTAASTIPSALPPATNSFTATGATPRKPSSGWRVVTTWAGSCSRKSLAGRGSGPGELRPAETRLHRGPQGRGCCRRREAGAHGLERGRGRPDRRRLLLDAGEGTARQTLEQDGTSPQPGTETRRTVGRVHRVQARQHLGGPDRPGVALRRGLQTTGELPKP